MLHAADEARSQPLHLARKLHMLQTLHQLPKDCAQFQSRKVRAQTEMLADAESHVLIRIALDSEFVRLLEDFLIAISRWKEQAHRFALRDLLAADLGVLSRSPRKLNHGRR